MKKQPLSLAELNENIQRSNNPHIRQSAKEKEYKYNYYTKKSANYNTTQRKSPPYTKQTKKQQYTRPPSKKMYHYLQKQ